MVRYLAVCIQENAGLSLAGLINIFTFIIGPCLENGINWYKHITKICPFKYNENFTNKKENFQIKNSDIFHISAQNIDCA